MRTRIWLLAVAVLVIAAAFGGCEDDAAGPDTLTGRASIRVGLDFLASGLPGGDAAAPFFVADLDTVNFPSDVFGRAAPSRDPVFIDGIDLDVDKYSDWENAPRFWMDDPRLPALLSHDYDDEYYDNIDMLEFERPDRSSRIDRWDYRSDIDYVTHPNSFNAVGLVRYGVQVNGLIDHLEIIVNNGVVEEPDSLVPLGGSPGGYPEHRADWWVGSGDACPPVPAGANPFILGHFKVGPTVDPRDTGADGAGETDADFCFLGSGLWQSGYENPLHPDSLPFAPNNFETFDLPQYNYLVIWEYDTLTNTVFYDRPHMRAQVGVELDLNGDPIPHAFAPFPTAPGRELSQFDEYADVLRHPRVTTGLEAVRLVVSYLKPLASGVSYQIWVVDEVEGETQRVSVSHVLQRPDTVGFDELGQPIIEWIDVGAPQTVTDFDGAVGNRHVIEVRPEDLEALDLSIFRFTHVAITIGGSADADPFESPAPVWYRYMNQNETRDDIADNSFFMEGATTFFITPEDFDLGRGWLAAGGGGVEYINVEGLTVGLERLSRPPLGYYYAVWLVNEDEGTDLYVGPITTPPPDTLSLFDADMTPIQPDLATIVTQGEILSAIKYATWGDLGIELWVETVGADRVPHMDPTYTHVYVTLEPKDGDLNVRAETVLLAAPIPADVALLPEEREAS